MLLGSELTRPDRLVELSPAGLLHHTLVLGQSGSGKSFCVARLIEELVLRTRARVVIIDPNGDFRSLYRPGPADSSLSARRQELQNLSARSGIDGLETMEIFADEWAGRRFLSLVPGHSPGSTRDGPNQLVRRLLLHWDRLDIEDQDFLLSIDSAEWPQLAAGVEACQTNARWLAAERPEYSMGNDLRGLADIAGRFSDRDISLSRYPSVKTLTTDDWLAVVARFKALLRQYSIWWSKTATSQRPFGLHDFVRGGFDADPEAEHFWNVMTLSLDAAQRPDALLSSYVTLGELWRLAKDAWRRRLSEPNPNSDNRVPTFIVIDEAHNFAPEQPRSPMELRITDRLIQFASEGRKYGLYLILATQRPTKLHRSLVAECENSCVLRIQSHLELQFASSVLGIPDAETRSVPRFDQGHALVSGRWVERDIPVTTYIGPARTVVGGGGLSAAWLERPDRSPAYRTVSDRIDSAIEAFLMGSDRPVASPVLASFLLDGFDELESGVWDGTGSFLNFLRSRGIQSLRIDPSPPGYIWLDGQHDPPESRPRTVREWGTTEGAAHILEALADITHLPRLDAESFRTIFEIISAEVQSSVITLTELTKKIRDITASTQRPINRLAANSVVKGILYSGHDWSTDLAQDAATLAAAYVRSQEYALKKAGIEISPAIRSEVIAMLGGGLVPIEDEPLLTGAEPLGVEPEGLDENLYGAKTEGILPEEDEVHLS